MNFCDSNISTPYLEYTNVLGLTNICLNCFSIYRWHDSRKGNICPPIDEVHTRYPGWFGRNLLDVEYFNHFQRIANDKFDGLVV